MNVITKIRKAIGLTQEEMAEAMDMSRSTLQRRERLPSEEIPRAEFELARVILRDVVDYIVVWAEEPKLARSRGWNGDVLSDAADRGELSYE